MTGVLQTLIGGFGAAAAAVTDAYFYLVTLLLPGNGTNGAQNNTFLDSSTNNFTITRNGNTTQGTFSPFSQTGWSNFFDGTGDYLTLPVNSAFDLGTNACSIEAWVYPLNTSAIGIFCTTTGGAGQTRPNFYVTTTAFQADFFGNIFFSGSATIPLNSWNHVVFTRDATNGAWRFFLNGVLTGYNATGTQNLLQTTVAQTIGFYAGTSANAYISNVRIVNGSVPTSYQTSSTTTGTNIFTPATAPLTTTSQGATSGDVKLLTCQSNRFIDSSANAFAITVNGNPSVQAFSPFAPTAAYSAATVGGSGYFDGSGDYLTVADNAALEPVGNNFCIEFSYYPTSVSGTKTIVGKRSNPSTDYGFLVLADGANARVYISSANTSYDIVNGTIIGTLVTNQWHHIAIYRISNAWYASFNGSITTLNASNSSSVNNNAGTWGIGADSNGAAPVQGYMANTRFVIGSSVYTSTSAPFPTAPLTAITNTQLLLNYTNAGITDATAKNDLETVGNAQISTTQSKFGGSSMYFDGTGDWLIVPNNAFYNFGSGDFTIEFWWYPNTTADQNLISKWNSATEWILQWRNAGNFRWAANGSVVRDATYTLSTGAWIHVAVSCASGSLRIFVNGTQIGTTATQSSITTTTEPVVIGAGQLSTTPAPVNGYFDDVRITRFARYTSNFTAPTAAFPVQ